MTDKQADGLCIMSLITAAGVGMVAFGATSNCWVAVGAAFIGFPASAFLFIKARNR